MKNLPTLSFTFLCIWCAGPASISGEQAPIFLDIQGEDFDKATHRPEWHTLPGQGWYSMEMKHCNGYAVAICDAQSVGSSITYSLDSALPPGKYRFFFHIIKMRSGGKNGVEIIIGDHSWKVIWDGKTYKVRDYSVDAHDFTLTKPARQIRIKSLMIERWSIGDVPEHPIPTIMLDRLMVTNDLRYQVATPGRRQVVALPDDGVTTAKETERQPILPGNRLANGSFEVGTTTSWLANTGYHNGPFLNRGNLVKTNPHHGRQCLEIGAPGSGVMSEMFRGHTGELVNVTVSLRSSGTTKATIGVYNTRGKSKSLVPKGALVEKEWKTFSGAVELPADSTGRYYIQIVPGGDAANPGKVWIDSVSVGQKAGEAFKTRDAHEVGLMSDRVANIYHSKDSAPAILTLANHGARAWKADLELIVRDHRNIVVLSRPINVTCKPADLLSLPLNIACGRWGIFSAAIHDAGTNQDVAELSTIVLPERKAGGICGFYGKTGDERTAKIMQSLGLPWNGTLADGQARHIREPKDFEALEKVLLVAKKHGIKIQHATEILYHKQQKDVHYEGTLRRHYNAPSLAAIEKDLSAFAERFKDKIDVWNLQDEMTDFKMPYEVYPLYHKIAVDAIRKADPDAVVIVSSEPKHQEQVLKVLGKNYLNAICDANFSAVRGDHYKHALYSQAAKKWDLPLWFSGFSFPTRSMYRTRAEILGLGGRSKTSLYRSPVDTTAAAMTVHRLRYDVERFVLYSAIPTVINPYRLRPTNIFDFDGTAHNVAAAYAAIGNFLQDATDGKLLETPSEELIAFSFQRKGDNWLTFWVGPILKYGEVKYGDYSIDLELTGSLLDSFGNAVPSDVANGRTKIEFEGQPLYFNVGNASAEKIAAAIKSAEFVESISLRGICLGHDSGGTLFRAAVVNRTGEPLSGTLSISEGRGMFVEGGQIQREISDISDAGTKWADIAFRGGLAERRPLSQGVAGLQFARGRISRTSGLWCMPAPRIKTPPALDGRLDDWRGVAPAFIHTTRRASGAYELIQVRRGPNSIGDENDIGASTFARWDEKNLYLALKVKDDDVQFPTGHRGPGTGDHAIISIDTNLMDDLFDPRQSEDDFLIQIRMAGHELQADLINSKNESAKLESAYANIKSGLESGFAIEIVCPWEKLGVAPGVGLTLGFDTTVFDADGSFEVQVEAAWAGFNKSYRNPTGYGQLILR
jgi:hypothetical protein